MIATFALKKKGYIGGIFVYRSYASTYERERHEFRTKNDTYLGISVEELNKLRKVAKFLIVNVFDFRRLNRFFFSSHFDFLPIMTAVLTSSAQTH